MNTLFTKDEVSLLELKSSIKCYNIIWPRFFTFTQQCADLDLEAKLFNWHEIVLKPYSVIVGWVHWPTKVLQGSYHVMLLSI